MVFAVSGAALYFRIDRLQSVYRSLFIQMPWKISLLLKS